MAPKLPQPKPGMKWQTVIVSAKTQKIVGAAADYYFAYQMVPDAKSA